jgi:hypothetical protein
MNPQEFREMVSKRRFNHPMPQTPPTPQHSMPSIPQMAMNLVKDGAKWIQGGMKLVADEVVEERMKICNSCEFYVGSRCSKCGCQMRVKTTLATSSCPIGNWGPVTTAILASNQTQTSPPAS